MTSHNVTEGEEVDFGSNLRDVIYERPLAWFMNFPYPTEKFFLLGIELCKVWRFRLQFSNLVLEIVVLLAQTA